MEQEKLYVIEEKTYEAHIDEEVHLYGLLHQLAFLAGKIKDREDVEAFIAAAKRYGQIADDKFDAWNIPGRYLVFGDKADLAGMKARELCELDAFYVECENDEPEPGGGRQERRFLLCKIRNVPFSRPCGATGNGAHQLRALTFAHFRGAVLMHEA